MGDIGEVVIEALMVALDAAGEVDQTAQLVGAVVETHAVAALGRNTRQLVPTQAADCFYQRAKRIIVEYKNALQDLTSLGEELTFYYFDMPSSAIKDSVISTLWAIDPYLKINQKDFRMMELLNKPWTPGGLYLVPEEFIHDPAVQAIEVAAVQHFVIMQDNHRLCAIAVKSWDIHRHLQVFRSTDS